LVCCTMKNLATLAQSRFCDSPFRLYVCKSYFYPRRTNKSSEKTTAKIHPIFHA
jgi:hypothetical protein